MFGNRGKKQFAPYRTKAKERFAGIYLHLMGLYTGGRKGKEGGHKTFLCFSRRFGGWGLYGDRPFNRKPGPV
jgi:hypothetical protein